jgi:hypothetical protein
MLKATEVQITRKGQKINSHLLLKAISIKATFKKSLVASN